MSMTKTNTNPKPSPGETLNSICVALTEAVTGMLHDANLGVEFAVIVAKEHDGERLSAVGSNMKHADAAETLSNILEGFKKAASH